MDHAALSSYLGSVVNTPPSFDRSPWEVLVRGGRFVSYTSMDALPSTYQNRPDRANETSRPHTHFTSYSWPTALPGATRRR